uniref:phage tail sheath family protein n=1 Tax=Cupriavidus necator TaxID=106590 RepID=UPI003F498151
MRHGMPGVSIERTDAAGAEPVVLRTDIAAFIGLAERGPLDTPVAVESWRQFQAHFGRPFGSGYLAYAVRGFFDNGGMRCWVVRVAARQFAGPDADEPPGGGTRSASLLLFDSTGMPRWRLAATSPGSWGNELAVAWRRERPLTQRALAADATGARLAAVAGFAPGELVRLEQPAASAHRVLVHVDAAAGRLYWVHPDPRQRGADQLAWSALDPAQPLTVERIAYTLEVWRRDEFAAQYRDLHLSPQHPRYLGIVLAPPYRSAADLLRVPPVANGALPAPPGLIQAEAIPAAGPPLPLAQPAGRRLPLMLGADGLAALAASDFLGAPVSPRDSDFVRLRKARGLQALAEIDEISLVAAPDILIRPQPDPLYEALPPDAGDPCRPCPPPAPPRRVHQPRATAELPPAFAEADILRVQTALIADCEARGDRFAVLSAPFERATGRSRGIRALTEWRRLLVEQQPARAAALYAPWLAVAENDGTAPPVAGSVARVRLVPACGHVAGAIANTDLTLGVMRAPANIPVQGVVDVRSAVNDAQHGELNDAGVDVLRAEFGRMPMLLGARTVSDEPEWRHVNTVRMLIALRRAFDIALRWAVFEPNDAPTRAAVASTLIAILTLFWQRGAFAGGTVEESFFVRCDEDTTGADAREHGQLIALVGIAPAAPAEFIVLRVGRQDNLPVFSLFERKEFA